MDGAATSPRHGPDVLATTLPEEAVHEITQPANLNSGSLQDIYKACVEEVEEPQALEVTYRDTYGRTQQEIIYVDPLFAEKRPRVCVSVSGIKSMHNAISVLTRKADNLQLTLHKCRHAYFKELEALREQLCLKSLAELEGDIYRARDVAFFDPKIFVPGSSDSRNEEEEKRLKEEMNLMLKRMLQMDEENALLKDKNENLEFKYDNVRSQLSKDPKEKIDDLLKQVNADMLLSFLQQAVPEAESKHLIEVMEQIISNQKGVDYKGVQTELEAKQVLMKNLQQQVSAQKAEMESLEAIKNTLNETIEAERAQWEDRVQALESELEREKETHGHTVIRNQALERRVEELMESGLDKQMSDGASEMSSPTSSRRRSRLGRLRASVKMVGKVVSSPGRASESAISSKSAVPEGVEEGANQDPLSDVDSTASVSEVLEDALTLDEAGMATVVRELLSHLDEESSTEVAGKLRPEAKKAIVSSAIAEVVRMQEELIDLGVGPLAEERSSERRRSVKQEMESMLWDPFKDLKASDRVSLILRSFKNLPVEEVQDVANGLGAKALRVLLRSAFEQADEGALRSCAQVLSMIAESSPVKHQLLKAFVSGIAETAAADLCKLLVKDSPTGDISRSPSPAPLGARRPSAAQRTLGEAHDVAVQTEESQIGSRPPTVGPGSTGSWSFPTKRQTSPSPLPPGAMTPLPENDTVAVEVQTEEPYPEPQTSSDGKPALGAGPDLQASIKDTKDAATQASGEPSSGASFEQLKEPGIAGQPAVYRDAASPAAAGDPGPQGGGKEADRRWKPERRRASEPEVDDLPVPRAGPAEPAIETSPPALGPESAADAQQADASSPPPFEATPPRTPPEDESESKRSPSKGDVATMVGWVATRARSRSGFRLSHRPSSRTRLQRSNSNSPTRGSSANSRPSSAIRAAIDAAAAVQSRPGSGFSSSPTRSVPIRRPSQREVHAGGGLMVQGQQVLDSGQPQISQYAGLSFQEAQSQTCIWVDAATTSLQLESASRTSQADLGSPDREQEHFVELELAEMAWRFLVERGDHDPKWKQALGTFAKRHGTLPGGGVAVADEIDPNELGASEFGEVERQPSSSSQSGSKGKGSRQISGGSQPSEHSARTVRTTTDTWPGKVWPGLSVDVLEATAERVAEAAAEQITRSTVDAAVQWEPPEGCEGLSDAAAASDSTPAAQAPAALAPAQPRTAEPAAAKFAAIKPAAVERAAAEPAPSELAPAEPVPAEPALAEPAPAQPAPAEPAPADLAPAVPSPKPSATEPTNQGSVSQQPASEALPTARPADPATLQQSQTPEAAPAATGPADAPAAPPAIETSQSGATPAGTPAPSEPAGDASSAEPTAAAESEELHGTRGRKPTKPTTPPLEPKTPAAELAELAVKQVAAPSPEPKRAGPEAPAREPRAPTPGQEPDEGPTPELAATNQPPPAAQLAAPPALEATKAAAIGPLSAVAAAPPAQPQVVDKAVAPPSAQAAAPARQPWPPPTAHSPPAVLQSAAPPVAEPPPAPASAEPASPKPTPAAPSAAVPTATSSVSTAPPARVDPSKSPRSSSPAPAAQTSPEGRQSEHTRRLARPLAQQAPADAVAEIALRGGFAPPWQMQAYPARSPSKGRVSAAHHQRPESSPPAMVEEVLGSHRPDRAPSAVPLGGKRKIGLRKGRASPAPDGQSATGPPIVLEWHSEEAPRTRGRSSSPAEPGGPFRGKHVVRGSVLPRARSPPPLQEDGLLLDYRKVQAPAAKLVGAKEVQAKKMARTLEPSPRSLFGGDEPLQDLWSVLPRRPAPEPELPVRPAAPQPRPEREAAKSVLLEIDMPPPQRTRRQLLSQAPEVSDQPMMPFLVGSRMLKSACPDRQLVGAGVVEPPPPQMSTSERRMISPPRATLGEALDNLNYTVSRQRSHSPHRPNPLGGSAARFSRRAAAAVEPVVEAFERANSPFRITGSASNDHLDPARPASAPQELLPPPRALPRRPLPLHALPRSDVVARSSGYGYFPQQAQQPQSARRPTRLRALDAVPPSPQSARVPPSAMMMATADAAVWMEAQKAQEALRRSARSTQSPAAPVDQPPPEAALLSSLAAPSAPRQVRISNLVSMNSPLHSQPAAPGGQDSRSGLRLVRPHSGSLSPVASEIRGRAMSRAARMKTEASNERLPELLSHLEGTPEVVVTQRASRRQRTSDAIAAAVLSRVRSNLKSAHGSLLSAWESIEASSEDGAIPVATLQASLVKAGVASKDAQSFMQAVIIGATAPIVSPLRSRKSGSCVSVTLGDIAAALSGSSFAQRALDASRITSSKLSNVGGSSSHVVKETTGGVSNRDARTIMRHDRDDDSELI